MKNFDKKLFSELLKKAKGDRSINAYAMQTGISPAHISRLERMLLDTPPSPEIIEKLADEAHGVTYSELMMAAGHIDNVNIKDIISNDVQQKIEKVNKLEPIINSSYFRMAKELYDDGVTEEDLTKALDFIKWSKNQQKKK